MKTNLELWISNFEGVNMKLIILNNKDNTYNWNYSDSDAMYRIWYNGKWGYTSSNYKEAIKIYENGVKEFCNE